MSHPGQGNQHNTPNILEILREKRNGAELAREEIEHLPSWPTASAL
jgi:hypothetical protein